MKYWRLLIGGPSHGQRRLIAEEIHQFETAELLNDEVVIPLGHLPQVPLEFKLHIYFRTELVRDRPRPRYGGPIYMGTFYRHESLTPDEAVKLYLKER